MVLKENVTSKKAMRFQKVEEYTRFYYEHLLTVEVFRFSFSYYFSSFFKIKAGR